MTYPQWEDGVPPHSGLSCLLVEAGLSCLLVEEDHYLLQMEVNWNQGHKIWGTLIFGTPCCQDKLIRGPHSYIIRDIHPLGS